MNPSFTVITFDKEYMVPLNYQIYYFNLSSTTSASQTPDWQVLHDYLDYYQLDDLSPSSVNNLALKVLRDEQTAIDF